jgi:hypothetical protein
MRVESYELQVEKTCRKCFTIFDYKRDYCCVKDKNSCFADLRYVRRGIMEDEKLAEKLFVNRKIDEKRNIIDRRFFRGVLRNECLVFKYRPPGCRSHFCSRWDRYIKEHPRDMVYANLEIMPTRKLLAEMANEFKYGIELAYPGGFIIYTGNRKKADKLGKELGKVFDSMKIKHFKTNAHLMLPQKNRKPGVEIIMDREGILEKPGLFDTLINNSMFMLVRMKMNMASAGFGHSNIMITTADPEKVAEETPASLKSFHALKAYRV